MPTIQLTTFIHAPSQRVFDLARSIDLHKKSMAHTGEQAVAGTTTGLIEEGETVTWKARHLYKMRILRTRITRLVKYSLFCDEMVQGDFSKMNHEHHFREIENGTLMIDVLQYESPYGALGRLVNRLYLHRYLQKLLESRNQFIKAYAESEKWKFILQV